MRPVVKSLSWADNAWLQVVPEWFQGGVLRPRRTKRSLHAPAGSSRRSATPVPDARYDAVGFCATRWYRSSSVIVIPVTRSGVVAEAWGGSCRYFPHEHLVCANRSRATCMLRRASPEQVSHSRVLPGSGRVRWKTDAVHQGLGRHVRLILNATSLGDPVTRIVARHEEKPRGIPRRFTRVSIGLEEPEDLIADFKQAMGKCS